MNIDFRKACIQDMKQILHILDVARLNMRKANNPNQWDKNYPSQLDITQDIESGVGWVGVSDDEIVLYFALIESPDKTYTTIKGSWIGDDDYLVIHRLAVLYPKRHLGQKVIEFALSFGYDIKVDTHKDNIPMQKLLANQGFNYCGIIYLENKEERLAYQKTKRSHIN